MAELVTAPAPAPASAAVPAPPSVEASPPAKATEPGRPQSQALDKTAPPAVPPPPDPAKRDEVRRAEALARAKREAAKVHVEREKLTQERLANQEAMRKAQVYDQLDKLKNEDPVKYMEAVGLKFTEVSKRYLEAQTGAGKSPADLVKEEVDRRMKAETEARERAAIDERARLEKQTMEGAKTQIAKLIQESPAYTLTSRDVETGVRDAWKIIELHFAKHGEVLSYDKALAGVEFNRKQQRLEEFKTNAELRAEFKAALKAEEEAAAATQKVSLLSSAKGSRGASPKAVETTEAVSTPTTARRRRPLDYRAEADKLLAEHKAKLDN